MAKTSTQRGMTMAAPVGRWRVTYAPGKSLILAGPTSLVLREPAGAGKARQRAVGAGHPVSDNERAGCSARRLLGRQAAGLRRLVLDAERCVRLVRGDVTITDPSSGSVIANGSDVTTWSESGLGNLTRVSVITGEDHESGPMLPHDGSCVRILGLARRLS